MLSLKLTLFKLALLSIIVNRIAYSLCENYKKQDVDSLASILVLAMFPFLRYKIVAE